jgi:hypothetical protein
VVDPPGWGCYHGASIGRGVAQAVARSVRDAEVGGSSPLAPTIQMSLCLAAVPNASRTFLRILGGTLIGALVACEVIAVPGGSSPSSADTSPPLFASASAGATPASQASAVACEPSQPLPAATDPPGVHPPDALLGADDGSWKAGEGNSFEWREGNVYSDAIGVPDAEPPRVVYRAPAAATELVVTVAKPIPFQTWKVVMFPWEWYDKPAAEGQPTKLTGQDADGTLAICLNAPEGEWYLSAFFDFGDGNHAKYRWHVVIPE